MKKGTQTASLFSFRKAKITKKGEDVMKKTTVTITFDEEKLSALKIYLEQKNQTAEEELEAALAALYNKTVPTGVREYLDLRSGTTPPAVKSKRTKPLSSSAVGASDGE